MIDSGKRFQNLLVPVDLTDKNEVAVQLAADLAGPDGSVCLLHVIEELQAPFEEVKEFYQRLESAAERKIDELAEPLRAKQVPFEVRIKYGRRARTIVDVARERAYDLIIITSHVLDPEKLTGGVMTISHQVAIAAPVPVLILR